MKIKRIRSIRRDNYSDKIKIFPNTIFLMIHLNVNDIFIFKILFPFIIYDLILEKSIIEQSKRRRCCRE